MREYAGSWAEYERSREAARREHEAAYERYVAEREKLQALQRARQGQARRAGSRKLARETGGTFGFGMFQMGFVPGLFRQAAGAAYAPTGTILPSDMPGAFAMGVRRPDGTPPGVHDVGVEIWSQPDAFTAWDPPTDDDVAHDLGGVPVTHGELWTAAAAGTLVTDGGRLLSVADPASPPGMATFTEPLRRGGSLVLVRNPDPDRLDDVFDAERATARA